MRGETQALGGGRVTLQHLLVLFWTWPAPGQGDRDKSRRRARHGCAQGRGWEGPSGRSERKNQPELGGHCRRGRRAKGRETSGALAGEAVGTETPPHSPADGAFANKCKGTWAAVLGNVSPDASVQVLKNQKNQALKAVRGVRVKVTLKRCASKPTWPPGTGRGRAAWVSPPSSAASWAAGKTQRSSTDLQQSLGSPGTQRPAAVSPLSMLGARAPEEVGTARLRPACTPCQERLRTTAHGLGVQRTATCSAF